MMCQETPLIIQILQGAGMVYTFCWYGYALLYLVLVLMGTRAGPFLLRYGPTNPRNRKWWKAALWLGLLPISAAMFLSGDMRVAVFLSLLVVGYGFASFALHSRAAREDAEGEVVVEGSPVPSHPERNESRASHP